MAVHIHYMYMDHDTMRHSLPGSWAAAASRVLSADPPGGPAAPAKLIDFGGVEGGISSKTRGLTSLASD